ncbi:lytic polysaccharide monooxygenase [Micromonospora sp. R77]|uniref:lytic polysaccharide monooxygenase n=1 Tax=Micromonospora sp. R77 TaxID=2925836 RepID=UPI001F60CFBF|nr:lytic polysaccharide monooxygenase [Micromonospora sp. R77]MCI4061423.1 lytic polysaccharide monooxygenase [Micromonospora sp. R77]
MKRKKLLLPLAVGSTVLTSALVASPAQAHGYVSNPPSRQAQCAQGIVPDCGNVKFEPQSVEAPKGSMQCNGGNERFPELNDDSKAWRATPVGRNVTFSWALTARHSTSTWEYFIGDRRIAVFDDAGRQPNATVTHNVDLSGYSGRQKLLARWNIADTAAAFYACIDLQVGGGTTPTTPPTSTPPTTTPPTSTPPTTTPPTIVPGTKGWQAGTAYATGTVVSYGGVDYRCLQAHTALEGWEPASTAALWQRL